MGLGEVLVLLLASQALLVLCEEAGAGLGSAGANQGTSRVSGASWLLLVPLSLGTEVPGCHPGL